MRTPSIANMKVMRPWKTAIPVWNRTPATISFRHQCFAMTSPVNSISSNKITLHVRRDTMTPLETRGMMDADPRNVYF